MGSSDVGAVAEVPATAVSAAQARIISAAIDLFAQHGVGGTSLQMIADEIGVTKAAVYHQYRTKDEIIIAAAEAELARMQAVVDTAETAPSPRQARDAMIRGMVDLAIDRRRVASVTLSDPVILRHFAHHEAFRAVMHRLRRLMVGDDSGPDGPVRTAMLIAAISGAVMHPFVVDLDDETLRAELLRLAHRFVGSPR